MHHLMEIFISQNLCPIFFARFCEKNASPHAAAKISFARILFTLANPDEPLFTSALTK